MRNWTGLLGKRSDENTVDTGLNSQAELLHLPLPICLMQGRDAITDKLPLTDIVMGDSPLCCNGSTGRRSEYKRADTAAEGAERPLSALALTDGMDTIAELRLPADDFALQDTLTAAPTVMFEAERITAHDSDRVLPLLWAAGDDLDAVEIALCDDPSVENVELLTDLDNEQLYRMEWVKNTRFVVHMLIEENAAIFSASGTASGWRFRVLFPDRDALSTTYEFCQRWDLDVSIESVYEMNSERHGRFGLTKDQSEVLVLALAHGYYEFPRGG